MIMVLSNSAAETNDDGAGFNRRQLLGRMKVKSFMKNSWARRSTKSVLDDTDCNDNDNLKKKKNNYFVQFDDEVCVIPNCTGSSDSDSINSNDSTDSAADESTSDHNHDIKHRWYQSEDYGRFKKDTVLTSLNYINAKRASKSFEDEYDEAEHTICGIEKMCVTDESILQREKTDKKYLFKSIRDEQARQRGNGTYLDEKKIRSVSTTLTKKERDRAVATGNEYAKWVYRQEQQENNNRKMRKSPSMKNLFSACRQPLTAVES